MRFKIGKTKSNGEIFQISIKSVRALFVAIANGIYQTLSNLTIASAYKTLPYIFITSSKEPLLCGGSRSTASMDISAIYVETRGSLEEGKSASSDSFVITLISLFIVIAKKKKKKKYISSQLATLFQKCSITLNKVVG